MFRKLKTERRNRVEAVGTFSHGKEQAKRPLKWDFFVVA